MAVVIDLFAGAGGLSLGAARAGFSVGAAVEVDRHAIETHAANFPNTVHIESDILLMSGEDILKKANIRANELTGIIGGPPCQGFSAIGQGDVNDSRNKLFVKFFEIIEELQPVFFVAENVPGIMKEKYDCIRQEAFGKLNGYTLLEPITVIASEYGAATTRTRVFFIGYRKCDMIHDFSKEDIEANKRIGRPSTTVEQALEGLPSDIRYRQNSRGIKKLCEEYCDPNRKHAQLAFYYEHMTSLIPAGVGDLAYVNLYKNKHLVNGCIPTRHSNAVRKRYAALSFNERDKVSKSVRLDPNGLCPTLRAGTGPDKGSYQAVRPIHYKYNRVITPREAARLQGFPDWFILPCTIWHSFRQIGNSVSPIVAESILSTIYQKLTR